jgi:hypothetical protein
MSRPTLHSSWGTPVAIALVAWVVASSCSYDFDAPFDANGVAGAPTHDGGVGGSGASTDGGSGTGGQSGVGGAGGFGGAGGVGGIGGAGGAGAGGVAGFGGIAGGAGTSGAAGAAGGSGGVAGAGGVAGSAGSAGAGATIAGHECSVVEPNGTGDEPGGLIPVCCSLLPLEEVDANELLVLVNEHRTTNGESPLAYDEGLASSMQAHLIHEKLHPFSGFIAPESSVSDPPARAEACGTTMKSSIEASGFTMASEVMAQWTQDAQADGILLNPNRSRAAAGRFDDLWAIQLGE